MLCNLVGYPACPAGRTCINFLSFRQVLLHAADKSVRRHLDLLVVFGLELLAPRTSIPLEDLQAP